MAKVLKNWADPELAAVPLSGAMPARGVKKGRPVAAGQLLAVHPEPGRADRHAPFSGLVAGLAERFIIIERGDQQLGEPPAPRNLADLEASELRAALKSLGLATPEPRPGEPLILSALPPDEGVLYTEALFDEHRETVWAGAEVLKRLWPGREHIWAVTAAGQAPEGARAVILKNCYPQGLRPLVKLAALGLLDPAGTGVADGRDLYLLGRAWRTGWPLNHLPLTLGQADYLVPLGARLIDLLSSANLLPQPGDAVIRGGFWQGRTTVRLTDGLAPEDTALHLAKGPAAPPWPPDPCRHCGFCGQVCPAGLPVRQLGTQNHESWLDPGRLQAAAGPERPWDDCVLCGLCQSVCPARRPLLSVMRLLLGQAGEAGR